MVVKDTGLTVTNNYKQQIFLLLCRPPAVDVRLSNEDKTDIDTCQCQLDRSRLHPQLHSNYPSSALPPLGQQQASSKVVFSKIF